MATDPPAPRAYLAQLRAAAAAPPVAPPDPLFDTDAIFRQARILAPEIRRLHETGITGTAVPAANRLRKPTQAPVPAPATKRKRATFEPSEDEEEEEEASSSSSLSIDTARLDKSVSTTTAATAPASGVAWSFTVPHHQASLEEVFVPYDEALEDVTKLIRFFRRRAARDVPSEERCFICEYGNPTYDRDPDYGCRTYTNMITYMQKNYGTAKNEAICIGLQMRFERGIDAPYEEHLRRIGLTREDVPYGIPRMTPAKFQAHIEDMHTLNAVMIIGEDLRSLLNYQRLLENRLIDKETQAYDPKVMGDLLKIKALKLKYATVNLKNANYNQGQADGLVLDPAKVQAMANLSRVESLLSAGGGNFIGGQTASDATLTTGDTRRTPFQLEGGPSAAAATRERDEAHDLEELRALVEEEASAMDIDE